MKLKIVEKEETIAISFVSENFNEQHLIRQMRGEYKNVKFGAFIDGSCGIFIDKTKEVICPKS